jgi:DNA replication licensing factor MCM2
LVLADQGVCLIDEFDKMNEQDRTSIHEAMEQQTISVSKAGIVASLQARCAVIAAANPIGGRYDPSYTLSENVELTDPILQRFDILCVLQDTVDPVVDEQLAAFVVNSHLRSHPEFCEDDEAEGHTDEDSLSNNNSNTNSNSNSNSNNRQQYNSGGNGDLLRNGGLHDDDGPPALDQDTLKKYIMYARTTCKPILHNVDLEKIASLYADLRKQSASSGGVPIAVRHIESVMRMAEASAKMHLRDHVRADDVDRAIRVMLGSFLQAQKVAVQRQLERGFRKYVNFGADTGMLLMHRLKQLVRDKEHMSRAKNQPVTRETVLTRTEFEKNARELGVYNCEPFYSSSMFKNLNFAVSEWQIIKTYV